MKRLLLISTMLMGMILVACGAEDNPPTATKDAVENTDINEAAEEVNREENVETETTDTSDITLPEGFPADFPIPNEFTITNVKDKSNEDKNHYSIDFDFDPSLDLEPVFDVYKAYSKELGYNIIVGGEEYFAEEIFQFGAHDPKSASNMFIVTLGTVDNIYGNIDVKFAKK